MKFYSHHKDVITSLHLLRATIIVFCLVSLFTQRFRCVEELQSPHRRPGLTFDLRVQITELMLCSSIKTETEKTFPLTVINKYSDKWGKPSICAFIKPTYWNYRYNILCFYVWLVNNNLIHLLKVSVEYLSPSQHNYNHSTLTFSIPKNEPNYKITKTTNITNKNKYLTNKN